MAMNKLVADVSRHNGSCDFAKMKQSGVKAVIIRAGYRGCKTGAVTTDEMYTEHIRKAVAAGLPVGVYWWTQAKSVAEAQAEADACVKLIGNYKLSFPVWLDLEYYNSKREGRADKLTAAKRTKYALAFLERCKAKGYKAGIYCNPDFWKNSLDNTQLQSYARWIAHYNASSATVDCDIWQYTSSAKGSTYGAASDCIDLNHMYTDFTAGAASKFAGAAYDGMYRVRPSWADLKNQKGAFSSLANAKKCCDKYSGYFVFTDSGIPVYPLPFRVTTTKSMSYYTASDGKTKAGTAAKGVYTITAVNEVTGYGKLKSGAGYLPLAGLEVKL